MSRQIIRDRQRLESILMLYVLQILECFAYFVKLKL